MNSPTIFIPNNGGESAILKRAIELAGGNTLGNSHFGALGGVHMTLRPLEVNPIYGLGTIGFEKYSSNKYLTANILRRAGLPVPKQVLVIGSGFYAITGDSESDNKIINGVTSSIKSKLASAFPDCIESSSLVMKPLRGCQGQGIKFLDGSQFDEVTDNLMVDDAVVIEERIRCYPVSINNRKKDWNLRVFVTYNFDKAKYTCCAIVGRIDDDSGPVNLSLTAKAITIDEILSLIKVSQEAKEKLVKEIINISEGAVQEIMRIASRHHGRISPDIRQGHQLLAGLDIIVNQDLRPYIIEVNGAASGGFESLGRISGVESLIPFAKSTVRQALQNIQSSDLPTLQITPDFSIIGLRFIDDREEQKLEKKRGINEVLSNTRKGNCGTEFSELIKDHAS